MEKKWYTPFSLLFHSTTNNKHNDNTAATYSSNSNNNNSKTTLAFGSVVVTSELFATTAVVIVAAVVIGFYRKYRSAIHRQLDRITSSTFFSSPSSRDPFRIIRIVSKTNRTVENDDKENETTIRKTSATAENPNNILPKSVQLLDLDKEFCAKYSDWQLLSLGEYMSSLRPNITKDMRLADWIENEIQAALAVALLRSIGSRYGNAILPILGTTKLQIAVEKIAAMIASFAYASMYRSNSIRKASLLPSTTTSSSNGIRGPQQQQPLQSYENYIDYDAGGIPISLFGLMYGAEMNYQRNKIKLIRQQNHQPRNDDNATAAVTIDDVRATSKNCKKMNSIQLLRAGEVGYTPSFSDTFVPSHLIESLVSHTTNIGITPNEENTCTYLHRDDGDIPLVPNPFIISKHWDTAIRGMEELIKQTDGCYDPNSKDMPDPVAIDQRILPDLFFGWGSAKCTHTKRQILKNRLLALLLNKLASNYRMQYETYQDDDVKIVPLSLFVVRMNETSPQRSRPVDFIQDFLDSGHTIETCIKTNCTTFGVALCVKEQDGSWSNIPLAYFLQNGLSDMYENESYARLPHSGLNLEIHGPLFEDAGSSIQHYLAIEGLCGWHSNHNVNVPWLCDIECGSTLHDADALECIRVAAMLAIVQNTVETRYQLPFGGYGLSGVCNDSAALIEYAISGKTHVYPLTFNGKFSMYNLRIAKEYRNSFVQQNKRGCTESSVDDTMTDEIASLDKLIHSIKSLPSDSSSLPCSIIDQCRRQLHCMPDDIPFTLMKRSRDIIVSIMKELE